MVIYSQTKSVHETETFASEILFFRILFGLSYSPGQIAMSIRVTKRERQEQLQTSSVQPQQSQSVGCHKMFYMQSLAFSFSPGTDTSIILYHNCMCDLAAEPTLITLLLINP